MQKKINTQNWRSSAKKFGFLLILFIPFGVAAICGCGRRAETSASLPSVDRRVKDIFESPRYERGIGDQAEAVEQLEALGKTAILPLERYLELPSERNRMTALLALQRLNEQRAASDYTVKDIDWYLDAIAGSENVLVRTYAMESLIRAGRRYEDRIKRFARTSSALVRQKLDIVLGDMRRIDI